MTYPMPTGWVPRQVLNATPVPGTTNSYAVPDLASQIDQYNQQRAMSGQAPIASLDSYGDPKQYLQMLAASNPDLAQQFAAPMGLDVPTLMQEAEASGYYERAPASGLFGKTMEAVGDVGNFFQENPALFFGLPFAVAGATGAFGAGGATTGTGSATVSASNTAAGMTPAAGAGVDVGALVSGGMGPQAVLSGAGGAAAAGGAFIKNLPAILSGASSLIGGKLASDSADDAVDAMTTANSEALDYQRESRDIALGLLEPERQSANAATARMLQMQGLPIPAALQAALDGSGTEIGEFNVEDTPGYQFRFKQSMDALESGAFARGSGMSGGFAQHALRYAQDYASTEYDKIYQQLGTLAGRSTAGGGAEVALNFGGNSGRIAMDTGAARASGYVAQGNAWQNALDQVSQLPWDQWFPRNRQTQPALAYGS